MALVLAFFSLFYSLRRQPYKQRTATSVKAKLKGRRKVMKATGQRIILLILRHVTAQILNMKASLIKYFLFSFKHAPKRVYFFIHDFANILFQLSCFFIDYIYADELLLSSIFICFLWESFSQQATTPVKRMQKVEMRMLRGGTPIFIFITLFIFKIAQPNHKKREKNHKYI